MSTLPSGSPSPGMTRRGRGYLRVAPLAALLVKVAGRIGAPSCKDMMRRPRATATDAAMIDARGSAKAARRNREALTQETPEGRVSSVAMPALALVAPGTAVREWTSGITGQWTPWVVGAVIAVVCMIIAVARLRRRRKARRAAELAWSRRGVISWNHVRKAGDLTGFQPGLLSTGQKPLPQLAVRIPDPALESPAWLNAGVTVHHDTTRATGQSAPIISSESESSLGWMSVGGSVSSLTYRMKGLPINPKAEPKAPQPKVVAEAQMLTSHSIERPADSAVHPSDAGSVPKHSADEAARSLVEAGEGAFVPVPGNSFAEPAATVVVDTAEIGGEGRGTPNHDSTFVEAVSQSASGERIALALADAKRLLNMGRPGEAIAALQPVLSRPDITAETWTVCGWARWRMASNREDELENAREAAHAFEQALKIEPQRIDLLSRMIGRCNLLCAQQLNGQERENSLDQAVRALQDARISGQTDHSLDLELAGALYERAMVSPHLERASWLDRVQHLIDGMPAREILQQGWLQANTLWARADIVDSRTAQTLHERASALVQSQLPVLDDSQRDVWLTRLIDGERAHLQRIKGAARIIRLQQLQPAIQAQLDGASSIAPLLSWISVLGDWADSLQGAAAPAKLDETEALFARIQAMAPENSGELNFAHAYYLRLRARRELSRSGQDAALRQAEQLLERISADQLPQALVQMESAEIHLARARLAEGAAAEAHYAEAAALGAAASHAPENEARALSCALTALVALQSHRRDQSRVAPMRRLATRLLSLTPTDANALRLAACVHFFAGEHGQASEFCEAAWNAGALRSDILPIWQQADTLWAYQLGEPDRHPQWKRLHQRMRMANSTS